MTEQSTPTAEAAQQQAQARRRQLKADRWLQLKTLEWAEQERDETEALIAQIHANLAEIEAELSGLTEGEQP